MPRKPVTKAELDRYNRTVLPPDHPLYFCRHCKDGWLEVARSTGEGWWDVYRFPCKCSYAAGKEWWMLADADSYLNLAPNSTVEKPLPHQFIHPSANRLMLGRLKLLIREKLAAQEAKDELRRISAEDLPF